MHQLMHQHCRCTQFQLNIPFGDCFSCQGRYDIQPADEDKGAVIKVNVHVAFSKSTMMKGKIESNTIATHQKNFVTFQDMVRVVLWSMVMLIYKHNTRHIATTHEHEHEKPLLLGAAGVCASVTWWAGG